MSASSSIPLRQRFVPCSLDGLSRTAVGVGPDDQHTTWIRPEDLVLAVEVVSADSVDRDREVKPRKYAAAGIRHYWRVEEEEGLPVVFVYELDPATRSYIPDGVHRNRLKVPVPYDIDIDLTAIDRRRP